MNNLEHLKEIGWENLFYRLEVGSVEECTEIIDRVLEYLQSRNINDYELINICRIILIDNSNLSGPLRKLLKELVSELNNKDAEFILSALEIRTRNSRSLLAKLEEMSQKEFLHRDYDEKLNELLDEPVTFSFIGPRQSFVIKKK